MVIYIFLKNTKNFYLALYNIIFICTTSNEGISGTIGIDNLFHRKNNDGKSFYSTFCNICMHHLQICSYNLQLHLWLLTLSNNYGTFALSKDDHAWPAFIFLWKSKDFLCDFSNVCQSKLLNLRECFSFLFHKNTKLWTN